MKIKFLLPFLAIALMASKCEQAKKVEGSTVTSPVPEGPKTTIQYAEEEYKFGKVMEGDIVEHAFEFTNTGKEPLIITDCRASCGCTVPEWPRDPVAPGATSRINAKFNTTGKSGDQTKVITVTGNTEPFETHVTISGFVEGKPGEKTSKVKVEAH